MAGISWVGTTAESSTVGSRPVAVPTTVKTPLSNTGLISTAQSYLPTTLSDSNTHTKIALCGREPCSPRQQEELLRLRQAQAQQTAMATPTCMVTTPYLPATNFSFPQTTTSSAPAAVKSEAVSLPSMTSLAGGTNSVPSTPPSGRSGTATAVYTGGDSRVLDKRRLQELVKEVDPLEQLDDDVEETLMQIADDFIDNVVTAACQIAKHRKANTVEVKDVQLHLERNWNMWIPGFGSEELRPFKKSAVTEAHKQRMALIKKTLKKY